MKRPILSPTPFSEGDFVRAAQVPGSRLNGSQCYCILCARNDLKEPHGIQA